MPILTFDYFYRHEFKDEVVESSNSPDDSFSSLQGHDGAVAKHENEKERNQLPTSSVKKKYKLDDSICGKSYFMRATLRIVVC